MHPCDLNKCSFTIDIALHFDAILKQKYLDGLSPEALSNICKEQFVNLIDAYSDLVHYMSDVRTVPNIWTNECFRLGHSVNVAADTMIDHIINFEKEMCQRNFEYFKNYNSTLKNDFTAKSRGDAETTFLRAARLYIDAKKSAERQPARAHDMTDIVIRHVKSNCFNTIEMAKKIAYLIEKYTACDEAIERIHMQIQNFYTLLIEHTSNEALYNNDHDLTDKFITQYKNELRIVEKFYEQAKTGLNINCYTKVEDLDKLFISFLFHLLKLVSYLIQLGELGFTFILKSSIITLDLTC
ncbi:hypothetical protein PAPYR_9819 [Paratrimastix pyriformis]|uniref:Uncharacterized protein n=1 Tax=Paratrimastix pyriformis TaxID=342808 RepID=A0ABQ8UD61_9EUKA|nr:hypothetical protein PAPYR_9819 [Paratrimastix pyriformis]